MIGANFVSLWRQVMEAKRDLNALLTREDIYWKQRSRVSWLQNGDRNTRFFHSQASKRKKINNISSLFDSHGGGWDVDLVREVFFLEDAEAILSLPFSVSGVPDSLQWHYSKDGHYSVKSGYYVGLTLKEIPSSSESGSLASWWKFIWSISVPPKVKLFLWRAAKDWLHTNVNLISHGLAVEEVSLSSNFLDFLIGARNNLRRIDFELLGVILWQVWFRRNKSIHSQILFPARDVVAWSCTFLADFRAAIEGSPAAIIVHPACALSSTWVPPPVDSFKLNCDASVGSRPGVVGLGFMIRNHDGLIMAAGSDRVAAFYSPQVAEVVSLLHGLQFAADSGFSCLHVKSDARGVIKLLNDHSIPDSDLGLVISDILSISVNPFVLSFNFVPRVTNRVADALAKATKLLDSGCFWIESCTPDVERLVQEDFPG
ncbi:hypothetical protein ACOSP7_012090 [Xanthoceras sorbifolium]